MMWCFLYVDTFKVGVGMRRVYSWSRDYPTLKMAYGYAYYVWGDITGGVMTSNRGDSLFFIS